MKKVLILTSGNKSKLRPFKLAKKELKIEVSTASFNEVYFDSKGDSLNIKGGVDIKNFDVIYFRLVGKSLETASLAAQYAKKNRIHIVDKIYEDSQVFPISMSKAMELKALITANVPIPKTFFGSVAQIAKKSKREFGFPFVIKSTSGSRGREVYSPKNSGELEILIERLEKLEKTGKKYFAQEYVNCTKRLRVLIVGGKVIGSISQLTKWRKRVTGYSPGEDEKKIENFQINKEISELALLAVATVELDVAGVDILIDDKTNKLYVIEVNAAPSWKLIKKYCRVNVEHEILKFIAQI